MAGYAGYSKSNNAVMAEQEGKLPLSRAIVEVVKATGCTRAKARAALVEAGPSEWHHTSKRFNRTNYYAWRPVANKLTHSAEIALVEPFFDEISAVIKEDDDTSTRKAAIQAAAEEISRKTGVSAEVVIAAYYDNWEED